MVRYRRHRVVINSSNSDWGQVIDGVLQESNLEPQLLLIYINDLVIGISSDISKFAEDKKKGKKFGQIMMPSPCRQTWIK